MLASSDDWLRDSLATMVAAPGARIIRAGLSISSYLHALLLLATGAFLAASLAGGLALLGGQYMAFDPVLEIQNMLTYGSTLGTALVLAGAALGPLALGWLLVLAAQRVHKNLSALAALALCAGVLGAAVGLCAFAWAVLIVPGETFHRGTDFNSQPDTLKQLLGGLIFAAFAPVALCAACVCVSLARSALAPSSAGYAPAPGSGVSAPPPTALSQPGTWRGLAWLLALGAAVTFASSIFTPVWNFSSTSYFPSQSLDSLGNSWSLLDPALKFVLGPPPADPLNWQQPIVYVKLYSDVVVYFTFVLGVATLGCVGTHVPAVRRALHRRYNCALPAALAAVDPFPQGACLGELLLAAALAGLYTYWVVYWGFLYTRITNEAAALGDAHPRLHVAARVFGHLTTLTMSFLCFPVARNSVWEGVFGVPFDRAMKAHRALGSLCWVLVTAHMLLWQSKWLAEGKLLQNVLTVTRLEITPCANGLSQPPGGCFVDAASGRAYTSSDGLPLPLPAAAPCPCVFYNSSLFPGAPVIAPGYHADNFTIVVSEAAWLLLTLALVVAVWHRRKHYEAFQYTHYAVLLFFAAGLLHAWAHWMYTAGGLILLAFDKVTRTVLAARRVECTGAAHAAPGVTRLTLSSAFLSRARPLYAGQYVWLNIPALSLLEWHPFTVSSPPAAARGLVFDDSQGSAGALTQGEGTLTLHIKDMGVDTWTGRLAALVRAMSAAEEDGGRVGLIQSGAGAGAGGGAASDAPAHPRSLALSIDGPYGRLGGVEDARVLLLFAGGIGVTPFAALLGELRARLAGEGGGGGGGGGAAGPFPPALEHVHVVWSVRDLGLVEMFADTLAGCAALPDYFTVHIFHTGSGGGGRRRASLPSPASAADSPAEEAPDRLLLGSSGGAGSDWGEGAQAKGWCAAASFRALADRRCIEEGRPAVEAHFARALAGKGDGSLAGADVLAMACGPAELSDAVSAAAFRHGTAFHTEVFTF